MSKTITMSSATLANLKADMDDIISKTLSSMQATHCGEATVSVKLKISLEKRAIVNEAEYREAISPKFEHTVSTSIQIKDQKKGSTSGDYELYRNPENGQWCIKDIKSQLSMFEESVADDLDEQLLGGDDEEE